MGLRTPRQTEVRFEVSRTMIVQYSVLEEPQEQSGRALDSLKYGLRGIQILRSGRLQGSVQKILRECSYVRNSGLTSLPREWKFTKS